MSTVSLQYVGKKDQHDDILYGTGLWGKGARKNVERDLAPFLLFHDDVWEDARATAARKKDPITPMKRPPLTRPHEQDVQILPTNISVMDASGLAKYAKNTFNRDLDASRPVADLRAEVRHLMRSAP